MKVDVFNKYQIRVVVIGLFSITVFAFSASSARASFWGDIINGVRSVFSSPTNDKPSITSDISLVSNGDLNHNGKIDSGDTVKFSYTITNPTKNNYQFADFRTNINGKVLNEINAVQGVASLRDDKGILDIPNFSLLANQVRKVSFEAKVNFSEDKDISLSTQPELFDRNVREIVLGEKKEVTAIKMDKEMFDSVVRSER
jgi:hypothetical protein